MSLFALVRYLENGDLDPGFGTGGKVTTAFGEGSANAFGLAIDQEDRVLLAGSVSTLTGSEFALTRHLSDGTLDRTFAGDGRLRIAFDGGQSFATAVGVDVEGRIVAVGGLSPEGGAGSEFAAVRLLGDGSLDPSFGTGGRVRTAFPGGPGFALAVSIDPSDRIVAAGFSNIGAPGSVFALVRYLEDGTLDRMFGHEGRAQVYFQGSDNAFGVTHDDRWRIVVVGKAGPGGASDAAFARLRPDGSLDPTFGVNGRAYSDLGGRRGRAFAVARLADDRIVVTGLAHRNLDQFGVARLLPGGDHDQSFSTDGRALSGFFDTEGAEDVAVDSAGRVVATGHTGTASDGTVFATARLLEDGAADPAFGLNGQVLTNFTEGSVDRATGVGIDSASRIIVGGSVGHPRGWPLGRGPYRAGERLVKGVTVPGFETSGLAMVYYPASVEGSGAPVAPGPPFPIAGFVHANRGAPPCDGVPPDKSQDYRQTATILRHLARWGYVVISSDASEAPPGNWFQEELLDASVKFLMAENERGGSPFRDKLRTTGIVLMGHSTGGGAALALAGRGVHEVAAVATLAPSGRASNVPEAGIPTLIVDVSEDDDTFGGNGGMIYASARPPKHHVFIHGANHFGFTEELCFGSDGRATISREDQQRIAFAYLTAFLQFYLRRESPHLPILDGSTPVETLESFSIEVRAELG